MGKHRRPNRIIIALTRAARKGDTNAASALRIAATRNVRASQEAQAALDKLDNT